MEKQNKKVIYVGIDALKECLEMLYAQGVSDHTYLYGTG